MVTIPSRPTRALALRLAVCVFILASPAVLSAAAWTGPGSAVTSQLEPGLDVVAVPGNANPLDRTGPANLVVNGDFTDNGFANMVPKKWGPASTNSLSGLGWISAVSPGVAGLTGTGTNGLPFRSMPGWTFTGGGTNTYAMWLPGVAGTVGPWSNGLTQWGPFGSKSGASSPQLYFGNDEGWSITPSMATLNTTAAFTEDVTQTPLTFTPGTPATVARNYVSSSAPTVFQEIATTPGDTYCMSYWVGHEFFQNAGSDARAGIARVRIGTSTGAGGNGYASVFFKVPTQVGAAGERWYTFQFVAKAAATRLAFTSWGHLGSGGTASTELVLDDVVVNHCAAAASPPAPPPTVGVGDTVWIDANGNGIQDGGEAGLPGVQVQLLKPDGTIADDAAGNPVAPVTTGAQGEYFIGGLAPGTYAAQFTLPSGYVFTTPAAGGSTSATDSNPSPSTSAQVGVTPSFSIGATAAGDTTSVSQPNATLANLTIDAGVVRPVGMGNYTWVDANANGIQDVGESPLAGVIVELLTVGGLPATDAAGNPVAPVITDALGAYFIGNLLPGSYTARFRLPSGYTFTTPAAGSSATDSNPVVSVDPLVGVTPPFSISPAAGGDTTGVSGLTNAAFANLTIAAGVVPVPVPSPVVPPAPSPAPDAGGAPSGSTDGVTPASGATTAPSTTRRPVVTAAALIPQVDSTTPATGGGATTIAVVIVNPTDAPAAAVRSSMVIPDGVVVERTGGGTVDSGRVLWPAQTIAAHGRILNSARVRSVGGQRSVRLSVKVSAGGRQVSLVKRIRIAVASRGGGSAVTG